MVFQCDVSCGVDIGIDGLFEFFVVKPRARFLNRAFRVRARSSGTFFGIEVPFFSRDRARAFQARPVLAGDDFGGVLRGVGGIDAPEAPPAPAAQVLEPVVRLAAG